MSPEILQLVSLVEPVQEELTSSFSVVHWDQIEKKDAWLIDHGRSIRIIITAGHLGVDQALMASLPSLGLIAIAGVGYEKIDRDAAATRGIKITNTPSLLAADVADTAIGLMIASMRCITTADRHVREGHWKRGEMALADSVSGRRYGIFGLGLTGQAVARRLEGFGGSISYTSRSKKQVPYFYCSTVEGLAANCDVLFITAAAAQQTHKSVDRSVLDALGPHGYLINVARGSIVDEGALVEALRDKRIAGAGLDVFADEPHVSPELLGFPNVALSPHIGSATTQAREAMAQLVLNNIRLFDTDRPLLTEVM